MEESNADLRVNIIRCFARADAWFDKSPHLLDQIILPIEKTPRQVLEGIQRLSSETLRSTEPEKPEPTSEYKNPEVRMALRDNLNDFLNKLENDTGSMDNVRRMIDTICRELSNLDAFERTQEGLEINS